MRSPSHDALERGVPLTPIFTPLAEKGVGQLKDWFPMGSPSQDALERGVPPTPILLPLDLEKSGASLGLVPDEVIVPGCFGTNRKIYKCHPGPVTSLYILGCVLSANISFRNRRDHGKTSKLLVSVTP